MANRKEFKETMMIIQYLPAESTADEGYVGWLYDDYSRPFTRRNSILVLSCAAIGGAAKKKQLQFLTASGIVGTTARMFV